MATRTLVSLLVGAGAGLAASALALQATGTWHATDSEVSAVIAAAAGCGAIATIRGAVDRFHSSIYWRRGGWLLLSITIAIGSIVSTTGWAQIAGGVIVLGNGGRTLLIALGAVSLFLGAVSDAYSDDRVVTDNEAEKRVESLVYGLIGTVLTEMKIDPQDLEVVIFVKTRRLLRFRSTALRIAYTTSVGLSRPHPNSIIYAPSTRDQVNARRGFRDTVWNAFHDGSDRAAPFANRPLSAPPGTSIVGQMLWQIAGQISPVYLWASPIKLSDKVVGVVALQTFAAHSWRTTTHDESFLTTELRSCANALADAMKADYE